MSLSPSGRDSAKSWEFSLWGRLSVGTLTVWVWISRMLGVCPHFCWHPPVGECLHHDVFECICGYLWGSQGGGGVLP